VLHQVGASFDLYYDARKHKIKKMYLGSSVDLIDPATLLPLGLTRIVIEISIRDISLTGVKAAGTWG